MKLDINLIWAIVVLLVAGMATAYSMNKQKLEKLKLTHPKLATVLETAGELALKATTYQASLDDKEGSKKLTDATDEVYSQLAKLYPNVPISRDTVRNYVQHMYDSEVKNAGQTNVATKIDGNKIADLTSTAMVNGHIDASKLETK
ncbi:holin [Lactobacillus gasseri]|jgi:2-oxo-4-hydroxy-4-carboxy--5-ureidoimidazoline (OHCU) decarboxylase|uniref:holin n=1 Tax=Lactobacillus gasseri TaxID=1596 RepID=UPI0020CA75BA|nr:holin [Lactobacillus gasseri]MCZ3526215.1 holin [Lactobacillus gasseri]MCZ3553911.1 holin [Lactobacillus gasseri]MDK6501287.1 holin [Lactobacillus gasseri]MDK7168468.1 holin [Lactobacillus gasseri]